MSNYTPAVIIGPINFDGDSVTLKCNRLTVWDMEILAPFMSGEDGQTDIDRGLSIIKAAEKIFPNRVEEISGLFINGSEVSKDIFCNDLINKMYFIELVSEIIGKLLDSSTVDGEEEGNLERPQEDTSRE